MHSSTRLIVRTALFLALTVLLPIAFHQFGLAGRLFLPMHLPVLLAGFICGPVAGFLVGLTGPVISFLTTGMPPTYAVPLMSIELPIYGLVAGLTYYKMHMNIYISLIISMIVGRLGFALALLVLGTFIELPYGIGAYFKAVIVTGLPGIIIQLVFIPPIVAALMRRR
ncbi:MAG: ECF transporter S component [candidate division Zixibacteria bacterium]|nr:ECF transporter S component [candidate division Zixibacteria bacterium]